MIYKHNVQKNFLTGKTPTKSLLPTDCQEIPGKSDTSMKNKPQ